ncbi:MAG: pectin methylesterase [Lachnospiraceae bacterium]|nr:pectin methylesterase [Lachnospiraceae bacterium]
MLRITVSKTGKGFERITEALLAVQNGTEEVVIDLEPGIYREKVEIRRSHVTLRGMGAPEETVIEFGDYAKASMPDGTLRQTFRSYVMLLDGDHLTLENLTVRNTAFPRKDVGQALALYADGDQLLVKNCHLESYQDTLFTGPLPPAPMTPGSFVGPKEFAERKLGKQRYENCVISGDVDFIFGSAQALFSNCEIVSRNGMTDADQAPKDGILGYVTAASTPEGSPVGYVFVDCKFTSDNCPPRSVYLGRPWRNFAKTILIRCELGKHIHPEGFHDWGKTESHETIDYGECQCFGEGADDGRRAIFVRRVGEKEAEQLLKFFEKASVFLMKRI